MLLGLLFGLVKTVLALGFVPETLPREKRVPVRETSWKTTNFAGIDGRAFDGLETARAS